MIGNYKVITLCGSTKFKEDFQKAYYDLSLAGNIVLSVCLFNHADDEGISMETRAMFDDMHRRKIDMSDEVFVINTDGYIGTSTRSEIDYAKELGKTIRYMYPYHRGDLG